MSLGALADGLEPWSTSASGQILPTAELIEELGEPDKVLAVSDVLLSGKFRRARSRLSMT